MGCVVDTAVTQKVKMMYTISTWVDEFEKNNTQSSTPGTGTKVFIFFTLVSRNV